MTAGRVAAVAGKEWREITRDRLYLGLAFALPLSLLLVFVYGLNLDVEHVPFALVDHDRSPASREFVYELASSRYFDLVRVFERERALADLLADGVIRAALVIPPRFGDRLAEGRSAPVQVLIDGTFPARAQTIKGYVLAIVAGANRRRLARVLAERAGGGAEAWDARLDPLRLEVRYLYNPRLKSVWSLGPAQIMFVLMFTSPLLTALSVVREKETGSIYNVYASTVTRLEFLAGKLLPQAAVAFVNLVILWAVVRGWFGVPFKGSLGFLAATSALFVLCTTGIGLLVSLLVRTQVAALFITVVATMVPTILYSGMLIPVASLERSAQIEAHLFPAMYYHRILLGGFLKGVGARVLWPEAAALAVYGAVLLGAGYALFSKRPRR